MYYLNYSEILNRQDNWIFTQHVSYEAAKEVLFNVTFNFGDCRLRPCANEYVTVHIYQRNNMDNAGRITTSNYQPLLSSTDSRLQRPSGSTSQTTRTLRYTRPPSSNGFYLGIRDEGTCGQVGRLIAHYLVCPRRVEGLVTYPEIALPPQNSPDVIFDAVCASNVDNTSSLQVRASSSGSCTALASGGPSCRCNAGYVLSGGGTTCTACSPGEYRTLSDTSCQQCPGNTSLDMEAAPLCTCVDGFYRTSQEGPEVGCTEPPTASRDLMVLSRTDTTLTISWSRPAITGRSDFFYRVLHTDPNGNLGEFVVANSELRNPSSSVTYRLSGLIPFTSYTVRVTTHNGVSNQDSVNDFLRETDINAMTQEGVPSQTRAIQRLCTVVVWQDPLQPNGRIVGYDLDFRNSAGQTNLIEVPEGSTFYLTSESERESGTDVRVRARTSVGPGDWTPYDGIGCMGDTPDCPPVECPPTTPCADVTTIPGPEDPPTSAPPLQVDLINSSPRVTKDSLLVDFVSNQRVRSSCLLRSYGSSSFQRRVDCSKGQVLFSGLEQGNYLLRIISYSVRDRVVVQRRLTIGPCAVHLINNGVTLEQGTTTIQFTGTEDVTGYRCRLGDAQHFVLCRSPLRYESLPRGRHRLRVQPLGCDGERLIVDIDIPFRQ